MKKTVCFLLIAVMLCALTPCLYSCIYRRSGDDITSNTSSEITPDRTFVDSQYVQYVLSDDGTYYIVYSNATTDVETIDIVIPAEINGIPVKEIGDFAFDHCISLKSIVIPDSVTNIGGHAFSFCKSLENINIPKDVASIGDWAFDHCTSLKSIVIPDSVTNIGGHAFSFCESLENINIPKGVASIGGWVFGGWTNAQSICFEVDAASEEWPSDWLELCRAEVYFNGVKIPPKYIDDEQGVEYALGKDMTYYIVESCDDSAVNVVVSDDFNGIPVKEIGGEAFKGCKSLESMVIPESVTSIGHFAFNDCSSLKSIVIPGSVTSIGSAAFAVCVSLKNIDIPEGVKSIGDHAFSTCTSLESIIIPESVTSIDTGVFYKCTSLKEIIVNENNTAYSSDNGLLFNKAKTELLGYPTGKAEKSVVVPDGVTSIGVAAFGDVGIENIILPNGLTNIDKYAFSRCASLKSVVIPEGVKSIGDFAFCDCSSLTSIVIPESVKNIGDFAFSTCTSLKSIVIPEGVKSVGESAFAVWTSDQTIYCCAEALPTEWDAYWTELCEAKIVWGYKNTEQ